MAMVMFDHIYAFVIDGNVFWLELRSWNSFEKLKLVGRGARITYKYLGIQAQMHCLISHF